MYQPRYTPMRDVVDALGSNGAVAVMKVVAAMRSGTGKAAGLGARRSFAAKVLEEMATEAEAAPATAAARATNKSGGSA
eukprot:4809408-Pleurochrysis_carterae.AAC.1